MARKVVTAARIRSAPQRQTRSESQTHGRKSATPSLQTAAGRASQRAASAATNGMLPREVRTPFEQAMGHSFADVRLHTDDIGARRAASVDAAAVTMGRDIFFGAGRYQPHRPEGRKLLAHELTHVAQWQRGGRARTAAPVAAARRRRLEHEADRASARVVGGGRVGALSPLEHATPLLHPVYISRHGRQGFLNNAFDFFTDWDYSPIVRGVDSIQQIVADLSSRSALGRVTIVSHAHPTNVMIALFNGGRPQLLKDDMQALTVPRTGVIPPAQTGTGTGTGTGQAAQQPPASVTVPGILPQTPTARTPGTFQGMVGREGDQTHLLPVAQLNNLLAAIAADQQAAARLQRIGSATDPLVRQYLWWTLDKLFIPNGGFAAALAARLQRITTRARESYRGTMQVAAAAAPAGISDRDFDNLDAEVRRLTTAWQWPVPPDAAAREAAEQRVASSPYAIVNAILWNPNFLPELAGADQRVRAMVQRLPRIENHYVPEASVNLVISHLPANTLQPLGGGADHLVRQWLWWVLEGHNPVVRRYGRGTRRRIQAAARSRRQAYRDLIIAAKQAAGNQVPTQASFNSAAGVVRTTYGGFQFGGSRPSGAEQRDAARQLQRSPQVTAVTGDSTFLRQLELARATVTSNTWFEIQGCRAGQDRSYLEAFRDMFANSRARPKVSAPNWFQVFGHYGWRQVSAGRVAREWRAQHVRTAFAYWYPILTGNALPAAPTAQDLLTFLQTPMMLPLISPGNTRRNRLLVLDTVREDALLAWFGRHGYRLTQAADIRQALFQSRSFGTNVRRSTIDWLAEQRRGGELRFRPDPDYQTHIIEVT